jgi:hypothetical protein
MDSSFSAGCHEHKTSPGGKKEALEGFVSAFKENHFWALGVSNVVWRQRILISNHPPQVIVRKHRLAHSRVPRQHDSLKLPDSL